MTNIVYVYTHVCVCVYVYVCVCVLCSSYLWYILAINVYIAAQIIKYVNLSRLSYTVFKYVSICLYISPYIYVCVCKREREREREREFVMLIIFIAYIYS